MPISDEKLVKFVDKVDELTGEMRNHEAELRLVDEELRVTRKRIKRAQKVATIGVVVGIIGVVVGIGGGIFGISAQTTADDLAESRRETQVSSCRQANETTKRTRDALIAGVSVLTAPNPTRTPNDQAAIDRFIVEYQRHVDGALPFRDCSTAGIKAYYANPPVDPALGGGTTTTMVTR